MYESKNIVATKRLFLTKLKWKRQNSRLNNQRHYKNLVVAWGRDSNTDFINGLFQIVQYAISHINCYQHTLWFHQAETYQWFAYYKKMCIELGIEHVTRYYLSHECYKMKYPQNCIQLPCSYSSIYIRPCSNTVLNWSPR